MGLALWLPSIFVSYEILLSWSMIGIGPDSKKIVYSLIPDGL